MNYLSDVIPSLTLLCATSVACGSCLPLSQSRATEESTATEITITNSTPAFTGKDGDVGAEYDRFTKETKIRLRDMKIPAARQCSDEELKPIIRARLRSPSAPYPPNLDCSPSEAYWPVSGFTDYGAKNGLILYIQPRHTGVRTVEFTHRTESHLMIFHREASQQWAWVRCNRVDILLDGEPMQPQFVQWDGDVAGSQFKEVVAVAFSGAQTQKLASAHTIEMRICTSEIAFGRGQVQSIRKLADASLGSTPMPGGNPDSMLHECKRAGGRKCRELASELLKEPNPNGELVSSLLLTACELDEIEACTELAFNRTLGKLMPKNYQEAADLLKKSCARGDARGCAFLGAAFEFGRGLPADLDAARVSYVKACRGGYERACKRFKELPTQ